MNLSCLSLCMSIILMSALGLKADCYLQSYHLRNEWHLILAYRDEQLQLLRQQAVEDGTLLYFVCNNEDITEVSCDNGHFSVQLPLTRCYNHLNPQLKEETDYRLCPHTLYRLGFYIRCRENNYFFETYKVCFDHQQMRAIFAINVAYPFVQGRPQGMQFDPDDIFTMRIFSAYNKRDIYARFQNLLGTQQSFMSANEQVRRIDRGHLTPVADYMTNSLISTTFKMINVIPQFHGINDGNWKLMEEWARNPINTPSKVCSGALHWVLELANMEGRYVSMYLRDNLIPIPLWTYKVVLNRHGVRTAFLQYNNIHDQRVPPHIPGDMCQPVSCPSNIFLRQSNSEGYTYCCEEGHFMRRAIPHLQGYC